MIELIQHVHRIAASAAAGIGKAKHGIVTAVDPARHAVKVLIQPEGNETGWIPDPGLACGDLRISLPCEIGTQVALEAIEGDSENLIITSRLFDAAVSPGVSPQTGKSCQPGEILIMTGQGAAPAAGSETGGKATQVAAWQHVTKTGFYAGIGTTKLAIEDGKITLTLGGSTYTATASAFAAVGGQVTSDQDVIAGSKQTSLATHIHTGVQSGPSNTGQPV